MGHEMGTALEHQVVDQRDLHTISIRSAVVGWPAERQPDQRAAMVGAGRGGGECGVGTVPAATCPSLRRRRESEP